MPAKNHHIVLDLVVAADELEPAVAFYVHSLGLADAAQQVARGWQLQLVERMSVLVCTTPEHPEPMYNKGRTPRLELRVADVDDAVTRALAGGATLRCRLTHGRAAATDERATYAQILDPFGHLWAFAREPAPETTT